MGRLLLVFALAWAMLPRAAAASPVDVFGFGSRHAAMASTGAATADDFAAGYYNPSGLAFGHGKRASAGLLGFASNLRVEDVRQPISEPVGVVLGVRTPAPLGGPLAGRIHLGVGVFLLPTTVARVIAHTPSDAFFPYFDNRTQRAVVLPGVAVRVRDDLAIGIAVNYLATLAGAVTASEGATRALDARVDEKIPSVARLNAGITWRPRGLPALRIAAAVRQGFSIPFSTDARVMVAGEPINVDIAADGVYTPTQLVLGAGWQYAGFTASADVTYANWSSYGGPFVRVRSELPLVGPLAAEPPAVPYSDTIGLRVGLERHLAPDAAGGGYFVRGGYGYETSPFPATQTGVTNLFDSPKHIAAAGFGVAIADLWDGGTLRVDVHAQAHVLAERTLDKRIDAGTEAMPYDPFTSLRDEVADEPGVAGTEGVQISNPGYPRIAGGGQVFSGGLTVGVGF